MIRGQYSISIRASNHPVILLCIKRGCAVSSAARPSFFFVDLCTLVIKSIVYKLRMVHHSENAREYNYCVEHGWSTYAFSSTQTIVRVKKLIGICVRISWNPETTDSVQRVIARPHLCYPQIFCVKSPRWALNSTTISGIVDRPVILYSTCVSKLQAENQASSTTSFV